MKIDVYVGPAMFSHYTFLRLLLFLGHFRL